MFTPLVPAAPVLAEASLAAPVALPALGLALAATLVVVAVGVLVRAALHAEAATRPRLRLVPTANGWGYSERATLDESAVGL